MKSNTHRIRTRTLRAARPSNDLYIGYGISVINNATYWPLITASYGRISGLVISQAEESI